MTRIRTEAQRERNRQYQQEYWARRRAVVVAMMTARTPSLPTVSILEKDLGLTNADYYAGKAAQAAAGLS
jgi:hypothetical protein